MSTTATTTVSQPSKFSGLRQALNGSLIEPMDGQWDRARLGWNLSVDQQPAAVVRVADAEDIITCVRWARENHHRVLVQPQGHAATSDLRRTILLRTSALDAIEIDLEARTVRVGAGVLNGELLAALDGTGLCHLPGSNPTTSVVGVTIGGGATWFSRQHGLACDSIRAAEIVDGSGSFRRVDDNSDPDLMWAIRGGGGNHVVVTALEIALHPIPGVYGGRLYWPIEQTERVLRAFDALTSHAPEELMCWFHTYNFPPLPDVPEVLRGKRFASVTICSTLSSTETEALLEVFQDAGHPSVRVMQEFPLRSLTDIGAEPTDPMPAVEHAWLIQRLPETTIVDLANVLQTTDLFMVQIRHLGGAFGRPPQTPQLSGAHGTVPETYQVFGAGVAATPALLELNREALTTLGHTLAPIDTGRCLLNFLGPDGDTSRMWSADTRQRLLAIKRRTDPDRVIHSNHPL